MKDCLIHGRSDWELESYLINRAQRHPERSAAESRDPVARLRSVAAEASRKLLRIPRLRCASLGTTALLFLVFSFCLTIARADAPPSAEAILAQVRLQQSQQQLDLHGQLRSDATVIPFRITQTGPVIRYTFANPAVTVQLQLGERNSKLSLVKSNSTEKLPASRLDEKIGGTDVTFGDLALGFLYWPNPQYIGTDSVRTRACWKLRLHPPTKSAQYSTVVLWVDQGSGAIMRLEAYDWKNQLAKKFEVISAQKIEGRWFLKQMRIEAMEPGTEKVRSRSYLEINK
ncbi:MAG: outer membrane lipoprotein-sorting protein [Chthoniobacterales bacterium]